MPAKVKVQFNRGAARAIRRSEPVRLALFTLAEQCREACDPAGKYGDPGYIAVSSVGKSRARAAVVAAGPYAQRSNAKHNTILTNVDAARVR